MSAPSVENVSTPADKAKLALSVGLLIASVVAYYQLSAEGGWIQWAVLLACLAVAVVVFAFSLPGRRLWAFGQDAWRETRKVVWPTRKEAVQMTLYVFGFVVLMALFLWLTDKTLEWVFYDLLLGWKK